jgi:hypothetical protein
MALESNGYGVRMYGSGCYRVTIIVVLESDGHGVNVRGYVARE